MIINCSKKHNYIKLTNINIAAQISWCADHDSLRQITVQTWRQMMSLRRQRIPVLCHRSNQTIKEYELYLTTASLLCTVTKIMPWTGFLANHSQWPKFWLPSKTLSIGSMCTCFRPFHEFSNILESKSYLKSAIWTMWLAKEFDLSIFDNSILGCVHQVPSPPPASGEVFVRYKTIRILVGITHHMKPPYHKINLPRNWYPSNDIFCHMIATSTQTYNCIFSWRVILLLNQISTLQVSEHWYSLHVNIQLHVSCIARKLQSVFLNILYSYAAAWSGYFNNTKVHFDSKTHCIKQAVRT